MSKEKTRGFTLIELMIALAIIGILAAIAYPSYVSYVRKGRRSDGISALMTLRQSEEKLRASCPYYGDDSTAYSCGAAATNTTVQVNSSSPEGYYVIAVTSNDANGFVATAAGQGDQGNDTENGTDCSTLTLTVSSTDPDGTITPADCIP